MHEDKIRGHKSDIVITEDTTAFESINSKEYTIGIDLAKQDDYGTEIELTPEQAKEVIDMMEQSNEKYKSFSITGVPETIKKNGVVLRKRTRKDYDRLWNLFKSKELKNFQKNMLYGEKEIKKIGVKKFIDAMDWLQDTDISKWITDIIHVIPCQNCGLEFTTYEQDLGLCNKCKKDFDLKRFSETCSANETEEPGISSSLRTSFVYDKTFRNRYRFKSLKEQIRTAIKEDFIGIDSYLMFKAAINEGRYDHLYAILEKHKSKITDRGLRILATVNDGISKITITKDRDKKLYDLYFGEAE